VRTSVSPMKTQTHNLPNEVWESGRGLLNVFNRWGTAPASHTKSWFFAVTRFKKKRIKYILRLTNNFDQK
jgi:hypothetical protein